MSKRLSSWEKSRRIEDVESKRRSRERQRSRQKLEKEIEESTKRIEKLDEKLRIAAKKAHEELTIRLKNEANETIVQTYADYFNNIIGFHKDFDLKNAFAKFEDDFTPKKYQENAFIETKVNDYSIINYSSNSYAPTTIPQSLQFVKREYRTPKIEETKYYKKKGNVALISLILTIAFITSSIIIGINFEFASGLVVFIVSMLLLFTTAYVISENYNNKYKSYIVEDQRKFEELESERKEFYEKKEIEIRNRYLNQDEKRKELFNNVESERKANFDNTERVRLNKYHEFISVKEAQDKNRKIKFEERELRLRRLFEEYNRDKIKAYSLLKDFDEKHLNIYTNILYPFHIEYDYEFVSEIYDDDPFQIYKVGYYCEDRKLFLKVYVPNLDVIPDRTVEFTPALRTTKEVVISDSKRIKIYNQFISSFALGHALIAYENFPFFESIVIECVEPILNKQTGFPKDYIRLQLITDFKSLNSINIDQIDPFEALSNFKYNITSIGKENQKEIQSIIKQDKLIFEVFGTDKTYLYVDDSFENMNKNDFCNPLEEVISFTDNENIYSEAINPHAKSEEIPENELFENIKQNNPELYNKLLEFEKKNIDTYQLVNDIEFQCSKNEEYRNSGNSSSFLINSIENYFENQKNKQANDIIKTAMKKDPKLGDVLNNMKQGFAEIDKILGVKTNLTKEEKKKIDKEFYDLF